MDFWTLTALRQNHPAWRLLRADHAPWIVDFLHLAFVLPNARQLSQAELVAKLEDRLYELRQSLGDGAFAQTAERYLDDWAADERGWLRKYYPSGSDEPHYDLTPSSEKAIDWLASLEQRAFVGTESRLLMIFDLLRQIVTGTDADPHARIKELEQRRGAIDAQIARIQGGELDLLDATALRDRFLQVTAMARGLLSDFREVEANLRSLDRSVRERIALWSSGKGELLQSIFGEHDSISDSDQGRSFRAFWDFLMSPGRQQELTDLLYATFELPEVMELKPDQRLQRMHYDWLDAGEYTQRTVAQLSAQLRRFLDDRVWLENRRIMQILHDIEASAVAMRDAPPAGGVMDIAPMAVGIDLAMERPLFTPPVKPHIAAGKLVLGDTGDQQQVADALFNQTYLDMARLAAAIRRALQCRHQITLGELLDLEPLQQGLAELVGYISLASDSAHAIIDSKATQTVCWVSAEGCERQARIPRVIFCQSKGTDDA